MHIPHALGQSAVESLSSFFRFFRYALLCIIQGQLFKKVIQLGATIQSAGEGGAGVFVADKSFISTCHGRPQKFLILLHVYIEQFLK